MVYIHELQEYTNRLPDRFVDELNEPFLLEIFGRWAYYHNPNQYRTEYLLAYFKLEFLFWGIGVVLTVLSQNI